MSDNDEQSPILEGNCAKCANYRTLPETNPRGNAICFSCWSISTLGKCASCDSFKFRPFKDKDGHGIYCSKNCQEQGEQTAAAHDGSKSQARKSKGRAPQTGKRAAARRPRRTDMGSLRARELEAAKAPREKKPREPRVPREKKPPKVKPPSTTDKCPRCGLTRKLKAKDADSQPQCARCNKSGACPGCGKEDVILTAKDAQSTAMCRTCNKTKECPLCHEPKFLCRFSKIDGTSICVLCALQQKERAKCPLCHKPKVLKRRSIIDNASICSGCSDKQTKMGICPGCKNPKKQVPLTSNIQTAAGIVLGCQVCYRKQKQMGTAPTQATLVVSPSTADNLVEPSTMGNLVNQEP